MQNKLNQIKNPQIISYLVFICMCLSFLNDWGVFTQKPPSCQPSDSIKQLETLHQLTSGCLQFSTKYCLKASLKQQKLSVYLADFNNWITYSRTYTKQDIGAQIHRKIDLQDIISVLKRQRLVDSKIQYNFGATQRTKSGEALYSIQNNGLLTLYVEVSTKNKVEIVQSRLNLIKERQMSELQIFHVKLQIQRRLILSQLRNQITQLKNQNKKINQRVNNLEGLQIVDKNSKILPKKQKQARLKQQQRVNNEQITYGTQLKRKQSQTKVYINFGQSK